MSNNKKVLILNADMRPYGEWDWKKAISNLLCKEIAVRPVYDDKGMIKHDFEVTDGKGNLYEVPAVLVLEEYRPENNKYASYSKIRIYQRDMNTCQYCGSKVTPNNRTIDHVIPRAHWNPKRYHFKVTSFENAVTSCENCNFKKRNRTPSQAGMKLLNVPKRVTRVQAITNKFLMMDNIPESWKQFLH